jgi:hypothetical protein
VATDIIDVEPSGFGTLLLNIIMSGVAVVVVIARVIITTITM